MAPVMQSSPGRFSDLTSQREFIENQLRFETPAFRPVGADRGLKAWVSGATVLGGDANPFQNTFDRQA